MKRLVIRLFRALRFRRPSPQTFLIPAYAGLGNFIMMTPMILELKRRVPGARIFLLTWPFYGTDEVFDAPVVDASGNVGCSMLDVGLKKQQPLAEFPHSSRPKSKIQNPESCPASPPASKIQNSKFPSVSGIFLLDPAAPLWRKVLFFLKLRRWRFETALIPFDACPPFVWWGFALAGCRTVAGHTMETMGITMGWTKSVLDISIPVNVGAHESDIHLDLLDVWERTGNRERKEDGGFGNQGGEEKGYRMEDSGSREQGAEEGSESEIHNPESSLLPPPPSSSPRSYQTHVAAGGVEVLAKYGLRERGYIVVQLSAANARFKTPKLWDRGRFAEVIRRFAADGETIVLPGDENEKSLVDAFVREHGLPNVINITGKTTVREISTVIKFAKLLLVHDSGLMHIGNAHGTPLLALYGPTDWSFTEPRAPTSHMLRKNLPCQPCMAKMAKDEIQALKDCPIEVQCMRDITADEVYGACRALLRSG